MTVRELMQGLLLNGNLDKEVIIKVFDRDNNIIQEVYDIKLSNGNIKIAL